MSEQLGRHAADPEPTVGEALEWLHDEAAISRKSLAEILGVARRTVDNWGRGRQQPSEDYRQRLNAICGVLQRASELHPTRYGLRIWLDRPRGVDGRTPRQLLTAGEFDRARYLAVARPSPRLRRAPEWVARPVPPAFQKGAERRPTAWPPRDDTSELTTTAVDDEDTPDQREEVIEMVADQWKNR